MYTLFTRLMNMNLVAGIMVLVILILRLCLKKAPRKFVCLLWALVALRLILPFSIGSNLSAFNLLNFKTAESGQVEYFQYNGKTEKPELIFSYPGLVNDNMSPDSMTIGTHTSDVYLPPLTYIWIFGVVCMSAYAAYSYLQLRRETAASIKGDDGIYVCDDIASPFILGIARPRIYLPSGMSEATKKNVIAHERTHIKRHDHWWKPLGYLLLSVYWFNPLLWLAYVLLCRDIEAACDEKVIEGMDRESISAYSEALLSCAVKRRMITACPVAFGETDVKGRVKNVLNYKKPAFWIICFAVILCIVAAVCLLTDPADAKSGMVHDPVEENYGSKTRIVFDNKVAEGINGILAECDTAGGFKLTQAAGGEGPLAAGEYEMLFSKANFPDNAFRDQLRFDVYAIDPNGSNILVAAGIPLTFYEDMRFELTEKDGVLTLINALSGEVVGSSDPVVTAIELAETGESTFSVNYVQNADGTYTTGYGDTYSHLLLLVGRSPNAVCDAFYEVLTDNAELDFKTVDHAMFSSKMVITEGKRDFVITNLGVMEQSWVWPCGSTDVSVYFGTYNGLPTDHINIRAEKHTPVFAARDGEVTVAEYSPDKGIIVEILHDSSVSEIRSQYFHLDALSVNVGSVVKAGDQIGTVGASGMATGPNLGFAVKVSGAYTDPLKFYGLEGQVNPQTYCPAWCREEDKNLFLVKIQEEVMNGEDGICRYEVYDSETGEKKAIKSIPSPDGPEFLELPDWLMDPGSIRYENTGLTASAIGRAWHAVKEMLRWRGEANYAMSYLPPGILTAESNDDPEKLCYDYKTGMITPYEGGLKQSDIYGAIGILQISPVFIFLVK